MGARIPIRRSGAAVWARRIGALPVPVLVVATLAHRGGILSPVPYVAVLAVGFILALVALALCIYALADIWRSGSEGAGEAATGFAYALPALLVLSVIVFALVAYPAVNDVTTDLDDPPELAAAEDAQATVPSPLVGIPGRLYDLPLEQVYAAARAIVAGRGWEVVGDTPPRVPGPVVAEGGILMPVPRPAGSIGTDGRAVPPAPALEPPAKIEAIARTPLIAMPDRVAIRLAPTPDGVAVDMRSASAVGEHDLGANGRRIKAFLDDLDSSLQGRGGLAAEDQDAEPELERP